MMVTPTGSVLVGRLIQFSVFFTSWVILYLLPVSIAVKPCRTALTTRTVVLSCFLSPAYSKPSFGRHGTCVPSGAVDDFRSNEHFPMAIGLNL